jgi:G:T-mismatch repair DNA endonuclease (very short patch repair protein)
MVIFSGAAGCWWHNVAVAGALHAAEHGAIKKWRAKIQKAMYTGEAGVRLRLAELGWNLAVGAMYCASFVAGANFRRAARRKDPDSWRPGCRRPMPGWDDALLDLPDDE